MKICEQYDLGGQHKSYAAAQQAYVARGALYLLCLLPALFFGACAGRGAERRPGAGHGFAHIKVTTRP